MKSLVRHAAITVALGLPAVATTLPAFAGEARGTSAPHVAHGPHAAAPKSKAQHVDQKAKHAKATKHAGGKTDGKGDAKKAPSK